MRMANFGVQRSNKDCQSVSFDWHLPLPCVRKQRMVRQGQPGHGQPGGCMCWWQLNKRLTLCHVERAISERSTGEAAFQHSSYGLTHQLHLHTYSNANVTSPKLTLFSCFTFLDFCFHCSFFFFSFFFYLLQPNQLAAQKTLWSHTNWVLSLWTMCPQWSGHK